MRPSELILGLGEDDIVYGFGISIECERGSCRKEVSKRSCGPIDRQRAAEAIDALSRRGLLDELRRASERLADPDVLCASAWFTDVWARCVLTGYGDCARIVQEIGAALARRRGMLEELKRRAAGRLGRLLDDESIGWLKLAFGTVFGHGWLTMKYGVANAVTVEARYDESWRSVDAKVHVIDDAKEALAEMLRAVATDVLGPSKRGLLRGPVLEEPSLIELSFDATDPAAALDALEAVLAGAASSGWIPGLDELRRRAWRTRTRVKA